MIFAVSELSVALTVSFKLISFYPRDAMRKRGLFVVRCLDVCLSARQSHAGIVSERPNQS